MTHSIFTLFPNAPSEQAATSAVCVECGALVANTWQAKDRHVVFHNKVEAGRS